MGDRPMIFAHPEDIVTHECFFELPDFLGNAEEFLRIEGLNPAGSIKLNSARAMVDAAEKRGSCVPAAGSSNRRPGAWVSLSR
jgi:cysteine synthase